MVLSQIIHLITLNLARKQKFQSINTTCTRITRFLPKFNLQKTSQKLHKTNFPSSIIQNSISTMSKAKATQSKSTPTKARVTFSDTTPSTPGTNTTSNTDTPTGRLNEETDDILFTETLNKVFSKKFLAILTGKDAILKEVRDCVLRNDPDRLQEISPYLFFYWRDLSVKHGCVCLDERIAIPKAIKDAVLEDIHSTHHGSFAMLSLAQNIWWPYIHRDIRST